MPETRREVREAVFILIFEKEFRKESVDEIIMSACDIDNFKLTEEVKTKFRGVIENEEKLDKFITEFSSKRSIDRIPKVNLAILRLALYEILFDEKVPLNVAINEAVLLAKKYAMPQDAAFVNGVLGSYARSLEIK